MRKVLLVSPHFPPDTTAATHRVRLLAPHLREFGWEPTVLAMDPRDYEGRLDPDLEALVPRDLRVVRARALPVKWTRKIGLGDLGLRALPGLRRACVDLLSAERYSALFITIFPTYPAILGPGLKRRFKLPFVLDYIDPWVGAWGLTVGGGEAGAPDIKSRLTRRLALALEPYAAGAADAITAVSAATYETIQERVPATRSAITREIPYGGEIADFDHLRAHPRPNPYFDPRDGNVHVCYVGTLLPLGFETLRAVLGAAARLKANRPDAYRRLRLRFFGTSNQTQSDAPQRVIPVARELGVDDCVTEIAPRVDYLDALTVQTQATAILMMGSSERHYTASKLYPGLLARRPILAVYHEESTVVSALHRAARPPAARVIAYGDDHRAESRTVEIAEALESLIADPVYDPALVNLDAVAEYSARALAGRLAEVFDEAVRMNSFATKPLPRDFPASGSPPTSSPSPCPKPIRLTIVSTHPIQYYSPWYRHIANHCPEIDLTVIYATQPGAEQQGVGFGKAFTWDVPLTEGYRSVIVRPPKPGDNVHSDALFGLDVPEIVDAIAAARPEVVLIPGWYSITLLRALVACSLRGIPALYRGDSNVLGAPRGWKRPLWFAKTRLMLALYSGYLAVGGRAEEYLYHFGAHPQLVFRSPHCVDNNFFSDSAAPHQSPERRRALRSDLGFADGDFVVMFAGMLQTYKGPLDLVAALGRLGAPFALLAAGAGPIEAECRAEAARLDVKAAWLGFQNQSSLGRLYAAADCLCVPSHRETWGLVVNEAMATGLPCVVSDAAGCAPDMIELGVTGETFAARDVDSLADALRRVRLRAGAHDMAPACRTRAAAHSFSAAADGLLLACRSLARGRHA